MKKKSKVGLSAYADLLREIKQRVRRAQYDALKAVNKELIDLYRDIGEMIESKKQVWAKQPSKSWGKAIVENLARDLRKEFPGVQGFSAQNLWRMRQFYLAYTNDEKLSPLVREIKNEPGHSRTGRRPGTSGDTIRQVQGKYDVNPSGRKGNAWCFGFS